LRRIGLFECSQMWIVGYREQGATQCLIACFCIKFQPGIVQAHLYRNDRQSKIMRQLLHPLSGSKQTHLIVFTLGQAGGRAYVLRDHPQRQRQGLSHFTAQCPDIAVGQA